MWEQPEIVIVTVDEADKGSKKSEEKFSEKAMALANRKVVYETLFFVTSIIGAVVFLSGFFKLLGVVFLVALSNPKFLRVTLFLISCLSGCLFVLMTSGSLDGQISSYDAFNIAILLPASVIYYFYRRSADIAKEASYALKYSRLNAIGWLAWLVQGCLCSIIVYNAPIYVLDYPKMVVQLHLGVLTCAALASYVIRKSDTYRIKRILDENSHNDDAISS